MNNDLTAVIRAAVEARIVDLEQQVRTLRTALQSFASDAGERLVPPNAAPKPRRRISAAGRKALVEANKRRWAAYRKQKEAAAKKATQEEKRRAKS